MTVEQLRQRAPGRPLRVAFDWRFGLRAFFWLLAFTLLTLFLTTSNFS